MRKPIPEIEVSELELELPPDVLVLDVREDHEWMAGHIADAVHMPMMDVPGRLAEIERDRRVLVVCRVGSRSAQVTGFLAAQGRQAVNLAGGMQAWEHAGRPMESESGATPRVV